MAIRNVFEELHKQGWKPEAAVAAVHQESGISERWLWNFWKEVVILDEMEKEGAALKRRKATHEERVKVGRRYYKRILALPQHGKVKRTR
jgi:hypothetical protein